MIISYEPPIVPITVDYEPIPDSFVSSAPHSTTNSYAHAAAAPPPSAAAAFGRVLLSVLLAIIGFAFILALIALIAVRPSNISKIVARADVAWLMEETDLGETIVTGLQGSDLIDADIDVDALIDFISRENVSEEIGRIAEGYARAIAEGDHDYYLTSRDIVNFIRAISPDINDEFGARLTNDDFSAISESLNEYVDLRDYRVGTVLDQSGVSFTLPSILLSIYPLVIVSILCSLVVFNLFILHRRKAGSSFMFIGVPLILSGLICIAAGSLLGPFSSFIRNNEIVGIIRLASGLSSLFIISGLVCLALGAISIVLFVLAAKARKKREPKPPAKGSPVAWRMAGAMTNAVLLTICGVLSLLVFLSTS